MADEDNLRRLAEALVSYGKGVEFTMECKDGLKRSVDSIEELLGYENVEAKEIKALTMQSTNYAARLRLGADNEFSGNILIEVRGEDAAAVQLSDAIDNRMAAMKSRYAFMSTWTFTRLVFVVALFVLLLVLALFGLVSINAEAMEQVKPTAIRVIQKLTSGLLVGVGLLVVAGWLDGLKARYFPLGAFLIGQGKKRYEDDDWRRNAVIIATAIALVVNFATGFYFLSLS